MPPTPPLTPLLQHKVAFKTLILVHILLREGDSDRILGYLVANPAILDASDFRDRTNSSVVNVHAKNLRAYGAYLECKSRSYRELKVDLVRAKADMIARFRSLPVEDGLLREVELLQAQIDALLACPVGEARLLSREASLLPFFSVFLAKRASFSSSR
ncbi:hypothetical protein BDK51DRAFT_38139 [Blyttiomyces helicus]|uniref:ENTH domain-containing protein n=1 Tax=Blyttiomyces helicus TaxID=388810 RepID=A0A4P9W9J3_9FUNG|nr:hypothetical protein BDK51DRAFT_38139 [Blyttiomyces helicus]|eukprot:RKO89231.1 hypothetical protein BDK51DRAFT_38139 [Blyttiomyces helicus]